MNIIEAATQQNHVILPFTCSTLVNPSCLQLGHTVRTGYGDLKGLLPRAPISTLPALGTGWYGCILYKNYGRSDWYAA